MREDFSRPETRRQVLRGLSALSLASLAGACGSLPLGEGLSGGNDGPGRSAVLLPLSGGSAALGAELRAAATLGGGPGIGIEILDAGSTPESAAAAARRAEESGAELLLGPVFSAQTGAVAEAVRLPLVTLSNNAALAGRRTFVFGVTPEQSARAILSLAAQRGLARVATVVPPGEFGAQSAAAAEVVGQRLGLTMRPALVRSSGEGLRAALEAAGGLPDAVYLPALGETLEPFAEALRGSGVQLLGSAQWSALDLSGRPAFRDAWFAAPDPLRFAAFDAAYTEATGRPAGIIAGLVFDGVEMLRVLGQAGQLSRRGLTREAGFTGTVGPYRFLGSGLCERGLGVLKVGAGEFSLIGSTSV
jgi:ABC-type branched-subunit amino acid transport system substrate-binding protein